MRSLAADNVIENEAEEQSCSTLPLLLPTLYQHRIVCFFHLIVEPIDCAIIAEVSRGCDFDHCDPNACGCRGKHMIGFLVRRESCGGATCVSILSDIHESPVSCPPGEHCFVEFDSVDLCPVYGTGHHIPLLRRILLSLTHYLQTVLEVAVKLKKVTLYVPLVFHQQTLWVVERALSTSYSRFSLVRRSLLSHRLSMIRGGFSGPKWSVVPGSLRASIP